jgi:hypothetical protein
MRGNDSAAPLGRDAPPAVGAAAARALVLEWWAR